MPSAPHSSERFTTWSHAFERIQPGSRLHRQATSHVDTCLPSQRDKRHNTLRQTILLGLYKRHPGQAESIHTSNIKANDAKRDEWACSARLQQRSRQRLQHTQARHEPRKRNHLRQCGACPRHASSAEAIACELQALQALRQQHNLHQRIRSELSRRRRAARCTRAQQC